MGVDNFIGASFSMHPQAYEQYNETKDGEIFEKLISDIILNKHSDDPNLTEFILSLPKEKQRLAVLSLIDKDRKGDVNLLWSEMVSYVNQNVSKMDHIKDVIKIINKFVKDGEVEKKKHGEVMTPITLVREMLDTLPVEVWSNPNLKWLDPANGAGTFPFVVIYKLMNGLVEWEPDEEKRYKHIVENMIYTCELQSRNVFLWLCGVDPKDEYTTNTYWGSFLDEGFDKHMKEVWGLESVDIVIGNPPYQDLPKSHITKTSGSVIWDKFVNKSINLIANSGYLVFVHPSIWRKPINNKTKIIDILSLFKQYNLIYLEIHDTKDGMKTFNAGTRYDFYCLQKNNNYKNTTIKDELGKVSIINIKTMPFIPNKNIDKVISLIGDDKISVIFDSSYHASRDYISSIKDDKHIYEVIHSTPKSGSRILYSSLNNKGHFGIPKLIFGESGINDVIIDRNGKYGMTQGAIGLIISDDDNLELMKKVLESKYFHEIIDSCMWSNFRIDAKLFMLFKKDWYKSINI